MAEIFPIMVKVWAGDKPWDYHYIKRSLPSLVNSDLPDNTRIIFIDDNSTDTRVLNLLKKLNDENNRVQLWQNPYRMGPNLCQEYNFLRLVEQFPKAEFYVLCDDDIIYHPMWLKRLINVYNEGKKIGLTGIFSALNVPFRPHYKVMQLPTSEVLLKERQAALNWLLPKTVYEKVGPFRNTGVAYDTDYCNRMAEMKVPIICLKPSYVQNAGYFGAYQSSNIYTAKDFVGKKDFVLLLTNTWFTLQRFARRIYTRLFTTG